MELKKNPQADLSKKSGLLIETLKRREGWATQSHKAIYRQKIQRLEKLTPTHAQKNPFQGAWNDAERNERDEQCEWCQMGFTRLVSNAYNSRHTRTDQAALKGREYHYFDTPFLLEIQGVSLPTSLF